MMLGSIIDYFGYGITMILFMGVPAAGLMLNLSGMQRRGLNRRAALAASLFCLTLLVQGTTVTLSSNGGISEVAEFRLVAGSGMLNISSALLALWAIWQVRRKHRWPHGRKRAIAVFWLNVIILTIIAATYFLRTRPDLEERIFG
jgi:cytochrome bd-type quinol oxidase subunit 2